MVCEQLETATSRTSNSPRCGFICTQLPYEELVWRAMLLMGVHVEVFVLQYCLYCMLAADRPACVLPQLPPASIEKNKIFLKMESTPILRTVVSVW